jgi:hypothetical protein
MTFPNEAISRGTLGSHQYTTYIQTSPWAAISGREHSRWRYEDPSSQCRTLLSKRARRLDSNQSNLVRLSRGRL